MISIIQRKIILNKIVATEVKPADQAEVEERLKRAKAAEVLFQNRAKQFKKTTKVKTTVRTITEAEASDAPAVNKSSRQPQSSTKRNRKKKG